MTIDEKKMGGSVRAVRLLRGMTQEQLAKKARMATNSIAILERGERGFSTKSLNALARALRVPASFLTVLATPVKRASAAESRVLAAMQALIRQTIHLEEQGASTWPRRRKAATSGPHARMPK